jgi:hypothetical protein
MTDATRTQTPTPHAAERPESTTRKHATPTACCGGPAPTGAEACCAKDAEAKSAGGAGCGCASATRGPAGPKKTPCCG